MLLDHPLKRADHLAVTSERQLRVHELLAGGHAQIGEARDLGLGEGLVGEVGERSAAPQRQRALERIERAVRPLGGELCSPLVEQALEAPRVDLLALNAQLVAVATGHEHALRQRLAEP